MLLDTIDLAVFTVSVATPATRMTIGVLAQPNLAWKLVGMKRSRRQMAQCFSCL